ncbi:DNA-binding protein [Bradyrhizobium erythrophlei]|uniref:Helix-turn-helix domain-containing protein n=1 Tax=Bradyrhizobium erythrophlei TaxID=1437360 RepID=A0A1M7UUX5_9BRAD|nr:DNA-binding protein [Bradyrhizobium erythrophlei]SHN86754.1 hypothetical protein SAMN05444170_6817 [Bradyrhizobium erythrophlei]
MNKNGEPALAEFEGFVPAIPCAEGREREASHDAIEHTAVVDGLEQLAQLRQEFDHYRVRTDEALAELLATVIEIRGDLVEMRRRASRAAGSTKLPAGWVTLKQAAYDTGYHRERIRQWAVEGLIKAKRDGGSWRVSLESVIAQAKKSSAP